jgi:hypothetical protein
MSADFVQRRAADGAWTRLHPAVYLVGGHRLTDEARLWAAWLWAGDDAVVSGRAAAFWHRLLPELGPRVELTVPPVRKPRPRPGVRVCRRALPDADITRVRGVAGLALTVLETAVMLPDGAAFLDRALQRHVRFDEVEGAYLRTAGTRGTPSARRLLSAAAPGAESAAERLLVDLLTRAGIRGWALGHPFGRWRIDGRRERPRLPAELRAGPVVVDIPVYRAASWMLNAVTRTASQTSSA